MIRRLKIGNDQIRIAMEHNEFGNEIITSSSRVAIIMTQDWCPQWLQMKYYLGRLKEDSFDIDVYEVLYNKEDYFNDFMRFKEEVFFNDNVPYIRFYIDGIFIGESNYISKT